MYVVAQAVNCVMTTADTKTLNVLSNFDGMTLSFLYGIRSMDGRAIASFGHPVGLEHFIRHFGSFFFCSARSYTSSLPGPLTLADLGPAVT